MDTSLDNSGLHSFSQDLNSRLELSKLGMSRGPMNGAPNLSCEIFYNSLLDMDTDNTSIPMDNLDPIVVTLLLGKKLSTLSHSFLSKIWGISSALAHGVL